MFKLRALKWFRDIAGEQRCQELLQYLNESITYLLNTLLSRAPDSRRSRGYSLLAVLVHVRRLLTKQPRGYEAPRLSSISSYPLSESLYYLLNQ